MHGKIPNPAVTWAPSKVLNPNPILLLIIVSFLIFLQHCEIPGVSQVAKSYQDVLGPVFEHLCITFQLTHLYFIELSTVCFYQCHSFQWGVMAEFLMWLLNSFWGCHYAAIIYKLIIYWIITIIFVFVCYLFCLFCFVIVLAIFYYCTSLVGSCVV